MKKSTTQKIKTKSNNSISSKKNSIINYVDSNASTSKYNTRQSKKRQTCEASDEEYEDIKKKQSTLLKNSKFQPEKFLDNDRSIQKFEKMKKIHLQNAIPDKLQDLPSDDEEDKKLNELGREIDCIISSEQVKRIQTDNDLLINFNCFDYDNIGSLGKIFCIKNPETICKWSQTSGNYSLSPLELLLVSVPNSTFRSSILEYLNDLCSSDRIKIQFDRFLILICYAFQLKPSKLKLDFDINKLLEKMYICLENEKPIENEKDIRTVLHENIYCFLDCWIFFHFTQWEDKQIISLLCLLCRLYLDKEMIGCRHRLSNAIKIIIQQLFIDNEFHFNSIFQEFCYNNLSKCADGNMGRAFELFTLFYQFEQFDNYKLSTFNSIFISISSTKSFTEYKNPSLGQVLSLLPSTVKLLKKEKRYNDLYFVYTRFVDQITIDKKLLQNEGEESLERAEKYFKEASLFLNKTNINDKMIDLWSRSLHRIRETLQNLRNNKTILDPSPCSKLIEVQQKSQSTILNKSENIFNSSSSDEEDKNK